MIDTKAVCDELAYFMRRLYDLRLTTTSGGNLSCRVDENTIALTPTVVDKGRLQGDQIVVMTMDGENLTPHCKPSIESTMHMRIYEANPAVNAVVHAHPPTASAFTATKTPINCSLLAESYVLLGTPVFAPYACMGTQDLAESVAEATGRGVCVMMENHGVLTVGKSLLQAFDRLELLDAAAQMTLISRQLDGVASLNSERKAELRSFRDPTEFPEQED